MCSIIVDCETQKQPPIIASGIYQQLNLLKKPGLTIWPLSRCLSLAEENKSLPDSKVTVNDAVRVCLDIKGL